ncbi:MAG: thioredoxin family protein, partial [Bacteroidales bacterium]
MKATIILQSIFMLAIVTFVTSYPASAHNHEKLNVHEGNFDSALNHAAENNKLVFVKTYTDWCGWCKRMDANTLSDPDVIAYLNEHFVTVKIDAEKGEGPDFAEKYDAKSYPTILFFNADGEIVHKFKGYKN